MLTNLDNYTIEGKKEIIRIAIETKKPIKKDSNNPYTSKAISMLSRFIQDRTIIDRFEIFDYSESECLLSEYYDGPNAYFFIILDGVAQVVFHKEFISYKLPGAILGSIGLAYSTNPGGSCASVITVSKHVIAARLLVTEDIRNSLRNDLLFLQKIAIDMAEIVRENNIYYLLTKSKSLMLTAYISVKMKEKENNVFIWEPKKADVVKELRLSDNSQLNVIIKDLIKKEGILSTCDKKPRSTTYYVNKEKLEKKLFGIDTHALETKFNKNYSG